MSTLQPARPIIIVTIGYPGAGKSFFARQFAETFHAPLISFDEIRYELFNEISHSIDEDIIVARVAGLQLRELIKTKRTLIIDGGHNPKVSRIELTKLAKDSGYAVLYVWVQTDERTSRIRSLKRSPGRDMDNYNRSLSTDEFEHQFRKFTEPSDNEPFVVISGRHTYATQARIALKRLANNHETPRKEPPSRTPQAGSITRRPISIN
ncbi:ATP-binding protein [Candidatus Saccharibacteria bacterium]|nr:ATP-binding protein [Candidatus Saccharibacteria bacterium]NCU40815.1 ATP-binding protein [Candidatus Saccharibacteria bacterium]